MVSMVSIVEKILMAKITANLTMSGVEEAGCPYVRSLIRRVTRPSPSSPMTRGFAATTCSGKLKIAPIILEVICHTGYVVMVLSRGVFGLGIHRDLTRLLVGFQQKDLDGYLDGMKIYNPVRTTQIKCGKSAHAVPIVPIIFPN